MLIVEPEDELSASVSAGGAQRSLIKVIQTGP